VPSLDFRLATPPRTHVSAFPHNTTPHNMASLPDMAELKLMKDNVWRKQQALKGEEEILADWNEQESIRDTVHGSH
jgi:hypothetical protein